MTHKRFLITGGSGFIGSKLIPELLNIGHTVTVLSRHAAQTAQQLAPAVTVVERFESLVDSEPFDVVINLAGQGIADKRWTTAVKQQLRDSRLQTTAALLTYLGNCQQKPELLISGSAIGYYGARDEQSLDEQAAAGEGFSSQLCVDWETQAHAAETLGIRTCYLRIGIVLGSQGGALQKMLPPFKVGLGGPMGNGRQWMSWIHMADLIGIMLHIIEHDSVRGAVNATAPNPVNNQVFASTLGGVLNRPAKIPMPAFVLNLMLGEMSNELLLSGQHIIPKKILEHGYKFQFPQLQSALGAIFCNR